MTKSDCLPKAPKNLCHHCKFSGMCAIEAKKNEVVGFANCFCGYDMRPMEFRIKIDACEAFIQEAPDDRQP